MIVPEVQIRGLDDLQQQLEALSARALPYAARDMLNSLAFAGREIWQNEMRASLTLRNAWTTRRALVQKASGYRMADIEAVLGHTEDYMRRLEYGIGEHAKRGGVPIPSEAAAGQAKGSLSAGRKRAVSKANTLKKAIGKIRRQSKSLSRKARNARAVEQAIRDGSRIAYLEMPRKRGIYRIMGGTKSAKVRKLYDLTRPFVPLPRVPTLQRSIQAAMLLAPALGLAAIQRQLDRLGRRSG